MQGHLLLQPRGLVSLPVACGQRPAPEGSARAFLSPGQGWAPWEVVDRTEHSERSLFLLLLNLFIFVKYGAIAKTSLEGFQKLKNLSKNTDLDIQCAWITPLFQRHQDDHVARWVRVSGRRRPHPFPAGLKQPKTDDGPDGTGPDAVGAAGESEVCSFPRFAHCLLVQRGCHGRVPSTPTQRGSRVAR